MGSPLNIYLPFHRACILSLFFPLSIGHLKSQRVVSHPSNLSWESPSHFWNWTVSSVGVPQGWSYSSGFLKTLQLFSFNFFLNLFSFKSKVHKVILCSPRWPLVTSCVTRFRGFREKVGCFARFENVQIFFYWSVKWCVCTLTQTYRQCFFPDTALYKASWHYCICLS